MSNERVRSYEKCLGTVYFRGHPLKILNGKRDIEIVFAKVFDGVGLRILNHNSTMKEHTRIGTSN